MEKFVPNCRHNNLLQLGITSTFRRMGAQAGGTQARASVQRIRRGGIASGVGLDRVRPPELRAVRGLLAFSRWCHASASPSRIGGSGERWADGCTSGRNASQGEPTAYQARWHRFEAGLDSVRPPELRAVRGLLAFSRWCHAAASTSRISGCRVVAHAGGTQA